MILPLSIIIVVICTLINVVSASTLYGLAQNPGTHLCTINEVTGNITIVGPVIPEEYIAAQLASIDEQRKIYYFISFNQGSQTVSLIGLELSTGKTKYKIALPFRETYFLGIGQTANVDPATGDLFVTGHTKEDESHQVYRVSPSTGKLTLIADIDYGDVFGGINAYDPVNKLLWLELAYNHTFLQLFALNVTNGKWVHKNIKNPLNLETMTFDPVTNLFYGIGLREDTATKVVRILMTFDSKSLKFTTIAEIPGYLLIDADLGTLDVKNRKLFCVMQPGQARYITRQDLRLASIKQRQQKKEAPFHLLTIDMISGKVEHNPDVDYDGLFPWSIEFLN